MRIPLGRKVFLSALHIKCEDPAGSLRVYSGPEGNIELTDNGRNGDHKANDGIASLSWEPKREGDYDLKFSDNDIVHVKVYDRKNRKNH